MQNDEDTLALITLRRAQVLRALAEARTEREIAEALSLSVAGVRSHVEDLKQITGHRSTRELARWWQSNRTAWVSFMERAAGVPTTDERSHSVSL
jgi:DNA-binding CsgD family transcriptional regulator